ncbi:MAG: DEAD/DEAH box helicase family protein [Cyanobacteria bacterium]|nr:DEAD/DEAH box helicase family protein [Cyanobacteriota bacterium]
MTTLMKFKFDANQPHQTVPVQAVVDLFEGQPVEGGLLQMVLTHNLGKALSLEQTDLGYGNHLSIADEDLQDNLAQVQQRNGIIATESLLTKGRNFSIEMETGTGKTYVYLRTAFELNQKYGFKKFIVVVPSVAIREGVLKSIEVMTEHFKALYNNVPFTPFVYDSKHVSRLTSYAMGNDMQIMIINIDAFNKDSNIINTPHEKTRGRKPIDFIQATHPIVILDEPQNMESVTAKQALSSLNPMCTLRYSATHKDKYNLLYSLDPVKAFQLRLVKKISIASVVSDHDATQSYVRLEEVSNKNNRFTAKLKFFKMGTEGPKIATATLKQDDNLYLKSKENPIYQHGFRIIEINTKPGMESIRFSNGLRLAKHKELGGNKDDIVKKQIRETIKAHFEKERQVANSGIKVLSLFFLDKVENYRVYHDKTVSQGKYAQWFEEIYNELAETYKTLFTIIQPVEQVHNGYFSKDSKGHFKNSSSGTSKDDEDTYSLIMKDKEKLLSLDNPLKFIFSHSALREGWDNPNVFQICTLNETVSTLKKRQEIGRGLRLPVNQEGARVNDDYINNLVVIANESYQDFVTALQREFEEECGVVFGRLPVEAFVGMKMTKDDQEIVLAKEDSESLWKHLKENKWIADDGFILEAFTQAVENHTFVLPEAFRPMTREIIQSVETHQIEKYVGKHHPVKGKVNEKVLLDPEFQKFWNAINVKTIYSVQFETEDLIQKASAAIQGMPEIHPPKLRTDYVDVNIEARGLSATPFRSQGVEEISSSRQLPDILTYLQDKVELTRKTIYDILLSSRRLDEFKVNPQRFMDEVVKQLKLVLHQLVIEGIQYEKLESLSYEMSRFREDEHKLEFAGDRIVKTEKSVYDYITYDSSIEKQFAEDLEHMQDVKYFIKLPSWFRIPTPVGEYNPDWAILKQNGSIVYMIRETKSTKDKLKLRLPETEKIACGIKHFESIGIDFDVAITASEALAH